LKQNELYLSKVLLLFFFFFWKNHSSFHAMYISMKTRAVFFVLVILAFTTHCATEPRDMVTHLRYHGTATVSYMLEPRGIKTFVLDPLCNGTYYWFRVGMRIRMATKTTMAYIEGTAVSFDNYRNVLSVAADFTMGSGTFTQWTLGYVPPIEYLLSQQETYREKHPFVPGPACWTPEPPTTIRVDIPSYGISWFDILLFTLL
jgi:hypothetical protein